MNGKQLFLLCSVLLGCLALTISSTQSMSENPPVIILFVFFGSAFVYLLSHLCIALYKSIAENSWN